MKALSCDLLKL